MNESSRFPFSRKVATKNLKPISKTEARRRAAQTNGEICLASHSESPSYGSDITESLVEKFWMSLRQSDSAGENKPARGPRWTPGKVSMGTNRQTAGIAETVRLAWTVWRSIRKSTWYIRMHSLHPIAILRIYSALSTRIVICFCFVAPANSGCHRTRPRIVLLFAS